MPDLDLGIYNGVWWTLATILLIVCVIVGGLLWFENIEEAEDE